MDPIDAERRALRDRIEAKCWECRAQDEGFKSEETGTRFHVTPRGPVECPASDLRDELDALALTVNAAD
jgi:hypothetical protein